MAEPTVDPEALIERIRASVIVTRGSCGTPTGCGAPVSAVFPPVARRINSVTS